MAMGTFDSLDEGVIKALDDKSAVKLLHKLIYAEAKRLSIPPDVISVPYEVDTPDGGIDAVFKTGQPFAGSELIFEGNTYYQVKSGKISFTNNGVIDVLCVSKKKGVTTRSLKPKVKQIAEENGTLVLFLTGQSSPKVEDALKAAEEIIKQYVPNTTMSIRIVQVENILALLDNYLSLRLSLLGISGFTGRTFDEWSNLGIVSNHFERDEQRIARIEGLRTRIQSTAEGDNAVRVIGYPGIGKTRSVLEALRTDDLSPLVIYFEKPSPVLEMNFLTLLGARNENEAIVVVDECDQLSHTQLISALAGAKSKVKLITIYNEELGATSGVKTVDLNENERLSSESIVAIMKHYQVPDDVAKRWEPFCDGSPRVAHMIAENLKRDTGNILANPSDDMAMERILANTDQLDSETFKKRRVVISWLALFHKFGWCKEFTDERKFILHKIQQKTGYSEQDIEEVIKELKERKVLQGDKTLYISPRLLHIRAWVWWWEQYGDSFDLNDMKRVTHNGETTVMSKELYEWFTQMFEYAREVKGASKVVRRLLSLDGPLANETELIEALSGNFFHGLAIADPENALLFIENWFSNESDDELRALRFDRMNLVRTLEGIAVWNNLFVRAAELLLRLAATEQDHTYSNNSEGTFAGLFSNGPGKVAPTEASPADRLPVLERALNSKDKLKQLMAVKGVNSALESAHFMKMGGPEVQGLRAEPQFWTPKTYGEQWDAFKNAWELILKFLPLLSDEVKDEAIKAIDNHMRGLLLHTGHGKQYIQDYTSLVKEGTMPLGEAVDLVNTVRRFDSKQIAPDTLKGVQELADYLEGDNLTSRLKRYIAHNSTEDWWGDDEDIKKSEAKVAILVQEIVANPGALSENEWLFTREAQNAYRLGRGLGELDTNNTLIDDLLRLQIDSDKKHGEESTFMLISGYLMSVYNRNQKKWQEILDRIANSPDLVRWYAEACWRSYLDDHNAEIILELISDGKVDYVYLRMFRLGAVVKELSAHVFDKWIEYLLSLNTLEATASAIDLFGSYYVFQENKELPRDLALRLITSPTLMKKNQNVARDIDYDWSIVAERYVEQFPDDAEELLDGLLENFGEDKTIYGTYGDYVKSILNKLVAMRPVQSWAKVAKYLEDRKHSWRLEISWLGGGASFSEKPVGALSLFPKDIVLSWIDEDPEKRASQIAYLLPHDYTHEDGEDSWYATILDRYGDNKAVLSSIYANFGTEGFSGPSSLHYAKKVEEVKRFGELHRSSPNIQSWVSKVVGQLNAQVQGARLTEERRDY